MRVAMLTNLTARASLPVLQSLAASSQIELAHVFFFDTLAASRRSPLTKLRQLGWKRIAHKLGDTLLCKLRILFAFLPGTSEMPPRSAYEAAVVGNLPNSITTNINDATTLEHLSRLNIDVLLVCVCANILKPEILELGRPQCVNIHPSLLPHYRGPAPTFWMLYHGENQTGYTIHCVTEKIDQGKVLAQRSLPLNRKDSELQIELSVFTAAAAQLEETLLKFIGQDASNRSSLACENGTSIRSDSARGTKGSYQTYPTSNDRRQLKKMLAKQST